MNYLKRISAAGLGATVVVFLAGADVSHAAGSMITLSGPSPLAHCPGLPGTITNFTAEPHMAVNPRDSSNVITAWQQDRSFGARGSVVSYSRDGGHSWRTVTVTGADTCTAGQVAVADPWLTFDRAGTAYLASIAGRPGEDGDVRTGLIVNRSDDGGATWSTPSMVTGFEYFDDKPAITADPNRAGTVYATWDRSGDECDNGQPCPSAVYFSASADGARTWSPPELVAPSPQRKQHNARVVVLPDGGLRLFYDDTSPADRPGPNGQAWDLQMVGSSDGGAHWSAPHTVAHLRQYIPTDAGGHQFYAKFFEAVTADADGRLYVVSTENTGTASGNPSAVRLRMSEDGGATWAAPKTLATPGGHASLPSIAVNAQGRVAVTWYDFADDLADDSGWTIAYRAVDGQVAAPNWHVRTLTRFDASKCGKFSVPGAPGPKIPWIGEYFGLGSLNGSRFGTAFSVCAPAATVGLADIVFATF